MPLTFFGPYRILRSEPIGMGGEARVYLARAARWVQPVALKVAHADDPDAATALRHEAEVLARLRHPNIVRSLDAGCVAGQPYLALEYAPYGTLKDELAAYAPRGERMSIEHALDIAQQVALGLGHIHQRGWVHADVKPSNILRGATGRYILCDFGLACALGARPPAQGTPEYMSPEQCVGLALDGRSDVYALGVVLYEMLTGGVPFTGESVEVVMHRQVYEVARTIGALRSGVPEWINRYVQGMLAKRSECRQNSILHTIPLDG